MIHFPGLFRIGALALTVCCFSVAAAPAADLYLQIQRGEKVIVAMPEFNSKRPSEKEKKLVEELHRVAKDDVLFTRLFNLIEEGPSVKGGRIDFEGWSANGADLLITANFKIKKKGWGKNKRETAQLIAAVFELPDGNPVFRKMYRIRPRSARKLAHEFVADFIHRFTGHRGVSTSRIALINDSTGAKELYMMDYDGENLKRITTEKSLVVLPRWSPDGKEILFTTYRRGNPDLAVYSLKEGKIKVISARQGLNSAASVSPDGSKIVATLSFEGSPSLYLLDREGNIIRRLTKSNAADTSASFSADGRKIIFASDRPGWPQIYMMDSEGGNIRRITKSRYCDAPVWSPLGDKIAYSQRTGKGQHDIIVQDLSTGKAYQLTQDAGSNENPSFSPDGRHIIFTSTRNRKREIFIASLDGTVQRKLADIPGSSYTPAWGP